MNVFISLIESLYYLHSSNATKWTSNTQEYYEGAAAWKEQDIPQSTSAALRGWRRDLRELVQLWAMTLTILFDLAWGDRRKRLSGQVQADL